MIYVIILFAAALTYLVGKKWIIARWPGGAGWGAIGFVAGFIVGWIANEQITWDTTDPDRPGILEGDAPSASSLSY